MKGYNQSVDDVILNLKTDAKMGLSSIEAEKRLKTYGPNQLEKAKNKSNLNKFVDQFKDAMIIILLIAAAISFGIALQEKEVSAFFEPLLILFIVVLNAIMGVFQENKAEKSLEALMSLSSPHARVIRDNQEKIIDAKDLVIGDLSK